MKITQSNVINDFFKSIKVIMKKWNKFSNVVKAVSIESNGRNIMIHVLNGTKPVIICDFLFEM